MSENKRGIALVHEICPICGKPNRTGQISGIKKDFKLFTDNPNFILKTNNNVSFCFIEENFGKQIGIFK